MRRVRIGALVSMAVALACAAPAGLARGKREHFPIAEAMAAKAATEKLDGTIAFHWGDAPHPEPLQVFASHTSNKKTAYFGKSVKEACDWAWLSAMLALQERARKEGGNAVVNIRSVWKDQEFVSQTEYECGAGEMAAAVSLRGDVVTLP